MKAKRSARKEGAVVAPSFNGAPAPTSEQYGRYLELFD
jgi:hypothetical protein